MEEDKVIAIDIDGTICSINSDYAKCRLNPGCVGALKKIRSKGYKIYLYTGRHINKHHVTVAWLKKNRVPYDFLVFGKPPARYYIDDRAIKFTSWCNIEKKIKP